MRADLSWWLFLFMPIAVFFACYLFHGGAILDEERHKINWGNFIVFGIPLIIYALLVLWNNL